MRLKQLINSNLLAVYIPLGSLYIDKAHPFNTNTADNIVTYYRSLKELTDTVDLLREAGVKALDVYPMHEVIQRLADDEFYIGSGALLWTEIGGEGVPDDFTYYGYDDNV